MEKEHTNIIPEQVLTRLQQLCSRREKCTDDVRKKLLEWKISPKDSEAIISQLQAGKFVDDRRYARAFVHDKFNLSGWGLLKIRNALLLKKIKPSFINEALNEMDNMAVQYKLEQILSQKNKTLKAASDTDRKLKLLRFAVGRGYDYSAAYDAITKMSKEPGV